MVQTAEYWIERLRLHRHPEGGYFREVYRSNETIPSDALPPRFAGERTLATSIYFLLPGTEVSCLHRLSSDEIWHFYTGSTLELHIFDRTGEYQEILLGHTHTGGNIFQAVIEHGSWFGAKVKEKKSFSLVGCTVAPGFAFDDFELGNRQDLLHTFPRHRRIIEALTPREASHGMK
jgi:predicted cupin superfamily sugar epimerase